MLGLDVEDGHVRRVRTTRGDIEADVDVEATVGPGHGADVGQVQDGDGGSGGMSLEAATDLEPAHVGQDDVEHADPARLLEQALGSCRPQVAAFALDRAHAGESKAGSRRARVKLRLPV